MNEGTDWNGGVKEDIFERLKKLIKDGFEI